MIQCTTRTRWLAYDGDIFTPFKIHRVYLGNSRSHSRTNVEYWAPKVQVKREQTQQRKETVNQQIAITLSPNVHPRGSRRQRQDINCATLRNWFQVSCSDKDRHEETAGKSRRQRTPPSLPLSLSLSLSIRNLSPSFVSHVPRSLLSFSRIFLTFSLVSLPLSDATPLGASCMARG